jgi:hypothetical protein
VAKFGSIEEFRAALNNLVANTGRSNPRRRRNPGQMFEALSAAGFETEEEVPEIGPRVAYTTRVQQLRAAAAAGDIDAAYELRDLEMRGERQRQKRKGKKKRGRKAAANPKRTKLLRRKQVRSSLWPEDSAQARMRTNMAFPKTINHPVFGPIQVDDMDELQALLASAPGAAPAAQPAAQPAPRGAMAGRPAMGAAVRGGRRAKKSLFDDIQEDYRFNGPYATAAMLLGGQGSYCPALRAQAKAQKATLSNQKALRFMGLEPTDSGLFKFLDGMAQLHPDVFVVKYRKKDNRPYNAVVREKITPAVVASAQDLINSMGITCPVVGRDLSGLGDIEAANNPYRRRRGARARRNVSFENAAPWVGVRETADSEIYKGFRSQKAAVKFASGGAVFQGPFDIGGEHYLGVNQTIEMPFETHYRAAANPRFW